MTKRDQCERLWRLQVGNRVPEERLGKQASVEVLPGLYVVRIAGDVGGKPVQAERAVDVAAGEIRKVELTLAQPSNDWLRDDRSPRACCTTNSREQG